MNSKSLFFGALAGVAVLGVALVLFVTRANTAVDTAGETLTVSFTADGTTRSLELRKVGSDALEGARFVSGSSSAKNTVVEFSDYQCPACAAFATQFEGRFKSELVDTGLVRFAYRDFPLQQHPNAPIASQAAACAQESGRFEEYKAILFRGQEQWSDSSAQAAPQQFAEYATYVGLNKAAFLECIAKNGAKDAIAADVSMGRKVGLSST
ncbi:MAG: DsbA family protein, partial [Deinococcales bacterium]